VTLALRASAWTVICGALGPVTTRHATRDTASSSDDRRPSKLRVADAGTTTVPCDSGTCADGVPARATVVGHRSSPSKHSPARHPWPASAQSSPPGTNPVPSALHTVATVPSQAGSPASHTGGAHPPTKQTKPSAAQFSSTGWSVCGSHVTDTAPSHRCSPGVHCSTHAPSTQNNPDASQSSCTVRLAPRLSHFITRSPSHTRESGSHSRGTHRSCSGSQSSPDASQSSSCCKKPCALHTNNTSPSQRRPPGVHSAAKHAPPRQSSSCAHGSRANHAVPCASQAWDEFPTQRVALGSHAKVTHAPSTHAHPLGLSWQPSPCAQSCSVCESPSALHVNSKSPSHTCASGSHTKATHAASRQTCPSRHGSGVTAPTSSHA
jgi:hypothetical protein